MALSEEQIERLREIERVKLEARAAFEQEGQKERDAIEQERANTRDKELFSRYADGGPSGECPNCGDELRARWMFCATCGSQVQRTCVWCQGRLPDREVVRFCPYCGKEV